jgi:putative MFS transporter
MRLDALPITSFHRRILWLMSFIFFFELGDLNTFAFAAPAIRQAWGLDIATIGRIVAATFVGMFIGATTGGWFSDRVGRKRALIVTTLWYSCFSLLNAFALGPAGLFVTRLLTGVGLSAMTVVGITYISEMFPADKRGTYQGWIMTIGLCGIPATAYVARFCVPLAPWGWRLVFVWGSLAILFPIFGTQLEESPLWYESQGELGKADELLNRLDAAAKAETGRVPQMRGTARWSYQDGGFRVLFSRRYLPRLLLFVVAWICQTLGFYGFTAWVPTLLVAHGFSLVQSLTWSSVMSLGAVPGALIAALISDRWNRKWWVAIAALLIAACGLTYGLSFRKDVIMVFGFLVTMLIQTFAPLLYAYTAECFPTGIRNSGTGLTYGIGRLANAFGPLLVAFLYGHYGYASVFVYIAATWVLVALAIGGFGPLTRGKILA